MPQSLVATASDFDPARLAEIKAAQATTVSVCLPARNEESTVGAIVETVRRELVDEVGLVDEVVVMDDGSSDATARVAADAGARVVPAASVLPELCCGTGKGEVMWKSLYASTGDLVCWLDADLRKFESHFVSGLLGPLLTRPVVGFVKAFYRRPLGDDPNGGGRVTELMARPLISTFFPHLTGVVQPLGGEYAGRRRLLEQLPFVEGWGVEIGLLVDVVNRFGASALAQVNLGVREHRNRSLSDLAPTSMAILQIALRRAGIDAAARGHELVRYVDGAVERVPVEVRERPPIIEVAAYHAKFGRELFRVSVRVLYTDIDGTLVGPMGSLFARSDGSLTIAAAAALHRAHAEGLEVVALSGRSRFGLDEVARLLGLSTWFGELGAVRVYEAGQQVVEDPGEFPGPGRVVDALVPAMEGILKEFAGVTEEHSPWNRGRDHSVMVRGEPPYPDVRSWLDDHGYGWVEMAENGLVPTPHHTVAGFDHVRVWHLTTRGISKRAAIAADRAMRGLAREDTAMIGDAVSDFECHTEVGRCYVMRNGIDRDPGLAELVDGARAAGEDVEVTTSGHTEGWAESVAALLG